MEEDIDIRELKELVQKQALLNADTNRVVHKLHRALWWGRLWSLVWWGAILVLSSAAYYYYLQPYLEQVLKLYAGAQGFEGQFSDFFKNFRP